MTSYSMIKEDEEHDIQFHSKTKAMKVAKMESIVTHRKHQVFLATTYRDLIPRTCWTITLQMY